MEAIVALSVASSILAAVQISNDFVRFVEAANFARDPRVKIIRYNLMTQRALTIAWANRMRSENTETWAIPNESVRDVHHILSEMQDYFKRAEDKMMKIYNAPDGKMTSRVFFQRFLFVNGGYEELKHMTEALDSMNRALLAIAPPPPSFYPGTSSPDKLAPSDVRPGASKTVLDSGGNQSGVLDTARIPLPEVPIEALYSVCLEALASICAASQQDPILEYQYDRLKLWGAGILKTGPSSLDKVFKANGPKAFQEALIRTLVYLAISEETILKLLCARLGADQQPPLVRQRREILATLGRDPLSPIAFERWANILADEQEPIALTESPPSISSLLTRSLDTKAVTERIGESRKNDRLGFPLQSHLPTAVSRNNGVVELEAIEEDTRTLELAVLDSLDRPESPNDEAPTDQDKWEGEPDQGEISRLRSIIGMLFDLLPAIRRVRRTYLRRLEFEELEKTPMPVDGLSSTASPKDDRPAASEPDPGPQLGLTFDQLLEHSLDLASSLETLLRNDETWARKNDQNVTIYSGVLRKEVDRLQDFKNLTSGKSDSANMQEVIGTIATLGKALNEAIKDIAAPEKPGPWQKTGSGLLLADAKSATVDADEKIREVIELFGAMNTDMWRKRQSTMVRA